MAKAIDAITKVPLNPNRALEIVPTFMYQLTSNMKIAASGASMRANAKRKVPKATCVAIRVTPHIMANPKLIRNAHNAIFCFGDIASILPLVIVRMKENSRKYTEMLFPE